MKFLSVYKSVERGVPPTQEEMDKMGKLIEQEMKAGTLLATEGCLPSALGARVRISGGKLTVTDGPFTEAKEVIAGFWIIQVNSTEEAREWAKKILAKKPTMPGYLRRRERPWFRKASGLLARLSVA